MKKIYITLTLVLISLLACTKVDKKVTGNFTNPNGETELATFMKSIHDETALAKNACINGEKYTFKTKEQTLFTSDAADPDKVASERYKMFGQAYLNALNTYKKASKTDLADSYNQMVGACENCHQALCPGPLVRVKKLYL
jgi:hypothetical protein